MKTIVLHRTFDATPETKGDPIFYIGDETGVHKLVGKQIAKWGKSLNTNITVRITNMSGFIPMYNELKLTGAKFVTVHWHKTGIAKGLSPEEIVKAFQAVSDEMFSSVLIRADIEELKQMIAARYAVLDFRRAAGLKFVAVKRSLGLGDDDVAPAWLQSELDNLSAEVKETEGPLDKALTRLAKSIPECILLNEIMGISDKSWMTAASIVAYVGDINRFGSVSSLWHYAGEHVVNGKAPKRTKGQAQTWNPKLRTALWAWSDSMLKTKNPIWRKVYDEYRAEEMAVHAQKHPDCKTVEGHCGARARRRVRKDVLKEFYIRMTQQKPITRFKNPAMMAAAASGA